MFYTTSFLNAHKKYHSGCGEGYDCLYIKLSVQMLNPEQEPGLSRCVCRDDALLHCPKFFAPLVKGGVYALHPVGERL